MNVYDQAHGLAQAIKESEEFKQFDMTKKAVEATPQLKEAIDDFMKQQMEFQAAAMLGQETNPEQLMKLQQLSSVLMQDPTAAQYMQNQMRFSIMMADVYKIIAEVADLGITPGM